MATTTFKVRYQGRLEKVQVPSRGVVRDVLAAAAATFKLPSSLVGMSLLSKNATLDLDNPVRYSGLPQNASLELRVKERVAPRGGASSSSSGSSSSASSSSGASLAFPPPASSAAASASASAASVADMDTSGVGDIAAPSSTTAAFAFPATATSSASSASSSASAAAPPPLPTDPAAMVAAAERSLGALTGALFDADARVAVKTLMSLVGNLISRPGDPTRRIVRLGNKNVHARCGRYPAAVALLENTGFRRRSVSAAEASESKDGKGPAAGETVLRVDEVRVWGEGEAGRGIGAARSV